MPSKPQKKAPVRIPRTRRPARVTASPRASRPVSPVPKPKKVKATAAAAHPAPIPRATSSFDDDDVLPLGGAAKGSVHGRCGGRLLGSRLERTICDLLSKEGVTHSHCPRHYEVHLPTGSVAAYAPMVVVRGRGREGKTVVIEAAEDARSPMLDKIRAFRKQYGVEFYVTFVAPEDVLDQVSIDTYDEPTSTADVATLVSRLAD
jgi:hypothetical protein